MPDYHYQRVEWKRFRDRCIARAGNVCERCDATGILQVHHPEYVDGKLPWDYPIEFCEVICRRCHAEVHGKIKPRGGWTIICSDLDRNEPSDPVPCENCGLDVTWHFTLHHPSWGEIIVGSECAENLSLGPEITRLKSFSRRLETFMVSPRWRKTPKGQRITYQGHSILVFSKNGKYHLKIDEDFGTLSYRTLQAALQRAFLKVDSL